MHLSLLKPELNIICLHFLFVRAPWRFVSFCKELITSSDFWRLSCIWASSSWFIWRQYLFTWRSSSEIILNCCSWGLLSAFTKAASCQGYYEEHNDNDSSTHVAQIILNWSYIRRTPTIHACITLAFTTWVADIKIFFHSIKTNCHRSSAVAERTTFLICAILVRRTCFDASNHIWTCTLPTASRETFKSILTVIKCLLSASVADTSGDAASFTATKGRLATVIIH